ncbi:MAG TPA: ATP-binding protein [Anaerolineales bacterium]|nr:ATP-binding protein [Anaerolineales bacterium]
MSANRGRFFRRVGCAIALMYFLTFIIFTAIIGLVLNSLGVIHIVYKPLGWVVPASILLSILGLSSLVWGGRGLRGLSAPFGDLLEAAGRIADGDYSPRVRERGPAELRALVRAFNGMAEKLQLTEEQRRDLMADITHELRTPLTVIQGNLEGFLDGVYSPDEAHLKSLLDETQILARLVEDLRTLSLAESGALQLKKEPTDLGILIGETISAFRSQADAAGVKLDVQGPQALTLNIDPERIRQVLSNLIANALRYTPRDGTIQIQYARTKAEAGKIVEVSVQDSGIGIAPDVLPHIFNRFFKSRDSSGTGLGLPIARHLVEAHGGTITAESQPGRGTIMRFTLPADE